ncbi:rab GTPase-activating protein 1-like [Synchiropus picturatus]
MMEEVSVMMAYDAQAVEQMSEEEILACLVEEPGPTFTVPSKKAKLKESRLQIMGDEDCLEKYLKENERLQQASLRLEQENDNLAHKLISSKVSLRKALDKTEDTVDHLTKDLMLIRHQLQATEEEKKHQEEEAAMLKDVFRRELEKAEREVKRSTGIIADYKQICSQLTLRLERQQVTHRQELESLKGAVKSCSHCGHVLQPDLQHESEVSAAGPTEDQGTAEWKDAESTEGEGRDKATLKAQIRELEQELASTKLQMVEAKCKIQELEHQKAVLANDLQEAKNSWISKAFTSLRTSSAGPHSHSGKLGGLVSGRSSLKLPWPHRDHRENI